ncbi:MAG: hypothetical protein M1833_001020 [Piccolia ochrophora]|nr:MAG: hypothetical protein M1833_001020 [Piccolia ochrophora]
MFGALNRFISRLDSDSPAPSSSGHGAFGFQVLRNTDEDLPIEPWFDFIVGINGRQIDDADPHLFAQEVRNCAGTSLTLGLWSAKGQRVRTLSITVPTSPPTLSLTLQWAPLSSTEDVWHILDVSAGSPADTAGLLPYSDYIIGTPEGIVRGESGLGELVEDHLSRPLDLHIYNHEHNLTRPLTITPSRTWGGSGALGCVLGYGALHRLPAPLQEPPHAPGETLFETARFSNESDPRTTTTAAAVDDHTTHTPPPQAPAADFLVPATQLAPSSDNAGAVGRKHPTRGPRAGRSAGASAAVGFSPNRAMDEYFREGEEKSREQDGSPAPTAGGVGAPPPPKKGGLPPKGKDGDAGVDGEGEGEEGDGGKEG